MQSRAKRCGVISHTASREAVPRGSESGDPIVLGVRPGLSRKPRGVSEREREGVWSGNGEMVIDGGPEILEKGGVVGACDKGCDGQIRG